MSVDIIVTFFQITGLAYELVFALSLCASHLPRRPHSAMRFLGIFALIVLYTAVWRVSVTYIIWAGMVQYTILFLLMTVLSMACWVVTWQQAVIVTVAAGMLQHAVYRGAAVISYGGAEFLGQPLDVAIYAYPLALIPCFILGWFFFVMPLRRYDLRADVKTLIPLIVGILLCVDVFANAFDGVQADASSNVRLIFGLFDEVNCIFFMILLLQMIQRKTAEDNSFMLQRMLAEQKKQLEQSKETIDLINIKTHDVKKQIDALGTLVDAREREELQHMIRIYDTTVDTGSQALDVVLQEKSLICEKRSIQFERIVDGNVLHFMQPNDIYALFNNALDNAIEAVSQMDSESKYVSVDVRKNRGMISIRVKNPFEGQLDFIDDLPRTTKGSEDYHGFGMKSMRMIVQRYGGVMSISTQNQIFTVSALIPERG